MRYFLIVSLLVSCLGLVACSAKAPATGGTTYGAPVTGTPISVPAFFAEAPTLEGETVTVSGTLGHVCDLGCWFFLTDPAFEGAGRPQQIYVDLQNGAVFTIPPESAGKQAVIAGKVTKTNTGWKLIGKGVVLS